MSISFRSFYIVDNGVLYRWYPSSRFLFFNVFFEDLSMPSHCSYLFIFGVLLRTKSSLAFFQRSVVDFMTTFLLPGQLLGKCRSPETFCRFRSWQCAKEIIHFFPSWEFHLLGCHRLFLTHTLLCVKNSEGAGNID